MQNPRDPMGPRRKPQWLKMVKNIFVKRIVSHSRRHHNQLKFFKKVRGVQKSETQEPNPRVTSEGRKAMQVYAQVGATLAQDQAGYQI